MISAPWRLLLPVLVAVSLMIAGPSNQVLRPAAADVAAARACWTYFGFYAGPPLMLAKDDKTMLATVHTPTAQEVQEDIAPLHATKWAELGAHLATAADIGQTGRTPQNEALLSSIDHGCNQLSIAAKVAGGWKPGF
jgi:hypothetical protein